MHGTFPLGPCQPIRSIQRHGMIEHVRHSKRLYNGLPKGSCINYDDLASIHSSSPEPESTLFEHHSKCEEHCAALQELCTYMRLLAYAAAVQRPGKSNAFWRETGLCVRIASHPRPYHVHPGGGMTRSTPAQLGCSRGSLLLHNSKWLPKSHSQLLLQKGCINGHIFLLTIQQAPF